MYQNEIFRRIPYFTDMATPTKHSFFFFYHLYPQTLRTQLEQKIGKICYV